MEAVPCKQIGWLKPSAIRSKPAALGHRARSSRRDGNHSTASQPGTPGALLPWKCAFISRGGKTLALNMFAQLSY